MIRKTWAYGTTRRVEVLGVETIGRSQVVTCLEIVAGRQAEGFVLVEAAGRYDCSRGDRGTLTFTRGGPTGGYWAYSPAVAKGGRR